MDPCRRQQLHNLERRPRTCRLTLTQTKVFPTLFVTNVTRAVLLSLAAAAVAQEPLLLRPAMTAAQRKALELSELVLTAVSKFRVSFGDLVDMERKFTTMSFKASFDRKRDPVVPQCLAQYVERGRNYISCKADSLVREQSNGVDNLLVAIFLLIVRLSSFNV